MPDLPAWELELEPARVDAQQTANANNCEIYLFHDFATGGYYQSFVMWGHPEADEYIDTFVREASYVPIDTVADGPVVELEES